MPSVVCHIEKTRGALTEVGQEVDREYTPKNADPERYRLNEQLVEIRSRNLTDDVNARIKEGHKGKKALRKDAVKSFKIILSGSHDQMKNIESNPEQLKAWKEANLQFLEDNFGGRANIVRATLHRDETTPHIHAIIVPIVNERLSAKRLLDGPKDIAQLQTKYAEYMKPFGLSRGKKGSTAKHTDVREYYGRVNSMENPFQLEIPPAKLLESPEKYAQRVQLALSPIQETLDKASRTIGELKKENRELKQENESLEMKNQLLFAYEEAAKITARGDKEKRQAEVERAKAEGIKEGESRAIQAINRALAPKMLKFEIDHEFKQLKLTPIEEKKEEKKEEPKRDQKRDFGMNI